MADVNLKITDRKGEIHEVIAPTDMSMNLMEVMRSYELGEPGTIGLCGGMAMCASCQVYILEGAEKLPEKSEEEEAMLGESFHAKDNSRLGCQIRITEAIDGLEVQMTPFP